MKVWFITGISRGLGFSLAKAALGNGDKVVGTVRSNPPDLSAEADRLCILRADMSDPENAVRVVHDAFAAFGRVDVIVNNAGYGLLGAAETSTDAEMQHLFEVDVFAPIRITRTALAYMRRQGSGHVVNITSIAGRAPGPAIALYAAAKHALEGFSVSLAQEVAPLGIKVTAVAPGQFRTDFLDETSARLGNSGQDAYAQTVGAALAGLRQVNHNQLGDPDRAAQVILDAIRAEDPPLHLLLGSDALRRAREKLDDLVREMAGWEARTVSTDHTAQE